jgi:DNA-directed RNA polymerase subunit RPC12/RpoP
MADHTALSKHSCAACGAQAEWNPAKQALICAFCGTEAPAELDRETGTIREIDLVRTLRDMPDELRGWKAEKRSVRCRSCNAISVFEP